MKELENRSIMKATGKLKVILEKSDTGYSSYEKDIAGIYTTGENIQEVKENIQEVIEVQVEYLKEQGKTAEAQKLKEAEVEYYLDVKQFFQEDK